ncbi:Armadillo-like helical [Artemisia annua]|uniref:Armadillo-like helical n=1 Tax=Artemisia annua TaxID=35608 RepID=A0A2U1PPY8_ARTAN|nr:Armadillo-like helical [Artemisia annua]
MVANNNNEAETSDQLWALTRPSGKTNSKTEFRRSVHYKYRVDKLNEPPPRSPGIRSLLPLPAANSIRLDSSSAEDIEKLAINELFELGDHGTAKSHCLKYVEKTGHRAVYTKAKRSLFYWTHNSYAQVPSHTRIDTSMRGFNKMNDQDRCMINKVTFARAMKILLPLCVDYFPTTVSWWIMPGENYPYLGVGAPHEWCLQPWRVGCPLIGFHTRNSEPKSFTCILGEFLTFVYSFFKLGKLTADCYFSVNSVQSFKSNHLSLFIRKLL